MTTPPTWPASANGGRFGRDEVSARIPLRDGLVHPRPKTDPAIVRRDTPLSVEVAVYRNGELYAGMVLYQMRVAPGSESQMFLPARVKPTYPGGINVRFWWDGSPMPGWEAFRVSLVGVDGSPLVAMNRPGLLFTEPSDCPSVVVMPGLHPPGHDDGMYALMIRVSDPYKPPAEPIDNCKCGAPIVGGVCTQRAAEESVEDLLSDPCPTTGKRVVNVATVEGRWVCCGGLYPDHATPDGSGSSQA